MEHIIKAIHEAAQKATSAATKEMRTAALNDGWSKDAARAVKADYVDGKFVTKLTGKHSDDAFVHEFGDQDTPPKATLRKAGKSTPATEQAFLSHIEESLRGVL